MSLNSFGFIVYLIGIIAVLAFLQFFRKANRRMNVVFGDIQKCILLLFSYFFLGSINWRFAAVVMAETVVLYIVLHLIAGKDGKKSKAVATIGISIFVIVLGYFKYYNFFIESFNSIFGTDVSTLKIILPIGISFYTFTAISYMADVCQNKYAADRNFLDVALYIAYFPKITAGPIVRGNVFLPQIKKYKGISLQRFSEGIQIFVFGLFKKIVLADRLGVFVSDVFHAPSAYNTLTVILAVISYSLQIYFDFSGYSDMAIGISKIFGIDLPRNFNLPYMAQNVSDFWKRWHISLSSWLKDYIYIPLGGSRKGEFRTCVNLMITMIVSGFWHGAGWTFVLWGFFYGATSCLHRIYKKMRGKDKNGLFIHLLNIVITFAMVSLFWIVFRASDFRNAVEMYKGCFTIHDGISQPYVWSFFGVLVLLVSSLVAMKKGGCISVDGFYPILNLKKFAPLVVFLTFIGLTIILGYFGNTAFIYGSF